jgi:hypothetical protein
LVASGFAQKALEDPSPIIVFFAVRCLQTCGYAVDNPIERKLVLKVLDVLVDFPE